MHFFIDFILHLDKHLADITAHYGTWTYAILMGIVFCETGFVVTPFLPGDSLLFAAGAVASLGSLNPWLLGAGLICAALLGDNVNYHVGKAIGPRVMKGEKSRLFNKKHLDKTHAFFEKYGGKTIVIARFVPIVRTFAPFVAGASGMTYSKFIGYSIGGAITWVVSIFGAGCVFGQAPAIKRNFHVVIVAIIVISILPAFLEFLKARKASTEANEDVASS